MTLEEYTATLGKDQDPFSQESWQAAQAKDPKQQQDPQPVVSPKDLFGGQDPGDWTFQKVIESYQMKKAASPNGMVPAEEWWKDVDTFSKQATDAVVKQQQDISTAKIHLAESQLEANIDTSKVLNMERAKRTAADAPAVEEILKVWNGLGDLQNNFTKMFTTAPGLTGPYGGILGNVMDSHMQTRGFLPTDIKAFRTQFLTIASPSLQAILGLTPGSDAKAAILQHTVPELMPDLNDSLPAGNAKFGVLKQALARNVKAFLDSRSGTDQYGLPLYNFSGYQALKPIMDFYNQKQQESQPGPNASSVFSEGDRNAIDQLNKAAAPKTAPSPIPGQR